MSSSGVSSPEPFLARLEEPFAKSDIMFPPREFRREREPGRVGVAARDSESLLAPPLEAAAPILCVLSAARHATQYHTERFYPRCHGCV